MAIIFPFFVFPYPQNWGYRDLVSHKLFGFIIQKLLFLARNQLNLFQKEAKADIHLFFQLSDFDLL